MYQISCCSTVDLPQSILDSRNIIYLKVKYTIDGKIYKDDLGKTMSYDEFYQRIDNGAMPTTSQANPDEFISHFKPSLEQGKDIIHITLSSGLSSMHQSAVIAKEILKKEYPNRKIYIVDSLGASSGSGMLVVLASDMQKNGASIDEVHDWIENNKLRMNYWFFTNDLSHLRRGGRISSASAIVGSMLNICPVMNVDINGKLVVREKVRGVKKAIKNIVEKMETLAIDGIDYSGYCYISHANRIELAEELKEIIINKFKKVKECNIYDIGCVIGSHTGPGVIAIYFMGKEREE